MTKPKMILFDYGQTLVNEAKFDGVKGTEAVLQYATKNKYNRTADEIQAVADEMNGELGRFDPARRHLLQVEIPNDMFCGYLYESQGVELSIRGAQLDKVFWDAASPGVPSEGVEDFLTFLKEQGIHTALDTCLFASKAVLEQIHPLVDQFLVDIKAMDPEVHRRCTGVPNEPILENIRYLDSLGKYMEIRIPFIPGHNDSQMEAIAKFLTGLKNRYRIKLLPYHDYGNAKAERLGVKMTEIPHPEPEQITAALAWFQQFGLDAVNGAAH